jgi:hypothetical protein
MKWLMEKLFGRKVVVLEWRDTRTPEQEVMYQEQLRIRALLGFEQGNDTQNWLRMHQILLDHENRLTKLETALAAKNPD